MHFLFKRRATARCITLVSTMCNTLLLLYKRFRCLRTPCCCICYYLIYENRDSSDVYWGEDSSTSWCDCEWAWRSSLFIEYEQVHHAVTNVLLDANWSSRSGELTYLPRLSSTSLYISWSLFWVLKHTSSGWSRNSSGGHIMNTRRDYISTQLHMTVVLSGTFLVQERSTDLHLNVRYATVSESDEESANTLLQSAM